MPSCRGSSSLPSSRQTTVLVVAKSQTQSGGLVLTVRVWPHDGISALIRREQRTFSPSLSPSLSLPPLNPSHTDTERRLQAKERGLIKADHAAP